MPKYFPSDPVSGDQVDVGYFDDAYEGMQNYVNYGIESSDLQGTGTSSSSSDKRWGKTQHIFKSEFYGAPSPRMEGVSCLVYHRHVDHGTEKRSIHHSQATEDDWVWVPGLVSTVKVTPPYERAINNATSEANFFARDQVATILTSFYAFDMGGSGSEDGENVQASLTGKDDSSDVRHQNGAYEHTLAAEFALFVNDYRLKSTDRALYTGTRRNWMGARKQFSMMKNVQLPIGVHNIGVRVKMNTLQSSMGEYYSSGNATSFGRKHSTVTPDFIAGSWKHVFVAGRNLVVHVDRR